jgi:N12 class adenine-specific DNA methylase
MGTKIFNPNQPQYVTFTKDDLASSMDLSGGFDIGHVALSIYTDNDDILISPSMFTVTFNR